jgi:hypothetical protein
VVILWGKINLDGSAAREQTAIKQERKAVKVKEQIIQLPLVHGKAQIFPSAATAHHGNANCGLDTVLAHVLFESRQGCLGYG